MRSTLSIRRLPFLGLSVMAALLAAMFAAIPAQAQNVLYSGRAYAGGLTGVTLANTPVPDQFVRDTGPLPANGGTVTSGPGTTSLPLSSGSVTTVTEQATGVNESSTATSQVSSASILPPGLTGGALTATNLIANTGVDCSGLTTLSSSVGTLNIAGQTVPINPNPNTTTTVVNSSNLTIANVTFNQQAYNTSTNDASANALVVNFPITGTLATLIRGTFTFSHADSDLTGCATPTTAPGFPRTGTLSGHPPVDSNLALLAVVVLLLISTSTGLLIWRRSI